MLFGRVKLFIGAKYVDLRSRKIFSLILDDVFLECLQEPIIESIYNSKAKSIEY